ncbi:hypothetical protein [Prevotella ihumii]|uniref:hypothetical protein n=1 Tax=Prevotella ihumii TaxID=1917878 RepID=UPI0009814D81|nr:hypothetical protein [Prevotella ihumii]
MRENIIKYLSNFDLDVRKSQDARFMDQKCAPDVVCFIADSIINTIDIDKEFAVSNIWDAQYFIKNARAIFNKPLPTNPKARHEYDKFIQQPLRMLAYAHVLEIEKRSGTNYYRVANLDILDYIAQRERNTYNFLYCYLQKVLSDSGIIRYFEAFKEKCLQGKATNADFQELKSRYDRFVIGHTAINTEVEAHRIFSKILNVYAVENQINGTEKGHMSKYVFTFSDLMYNRKNWRDLNKDKSITRQEAQEQQDVEQQEAYNAYYVQKAMKLLRKIQIESEVHDQWGNGEATQIHHIFPKSQFPQLAHYLENLIKLTATQHYTLAHPSNRTQQINRDYQLTCLLAKADTVETSLKAVGEKYYRKESFVYVINTGLATHLSTNLQFKDIKSSLIQIYNY